MTLLNWFTVPLILSCAATAHVAHYYETDDIALAVTVCVIAYSAIYAILAVSASPHTRAFAILVIILSAIASLIIKGLKIKGEEAERERQRAIQKQQDETRKQ